LADEKSSGGRAAPTILDIVHKLDRLCQISRIDRNKLKADLERHHQISSKTVESWFNQKDAAVRYRGRDAIIKYFSETHGLLIGHEIFSASREQFDTICERLLDAGSQARNAEGESFPQCVGKH
jgi:hypothetical protein